MKSEFVYVDMHRQDATGKHLEWRRVKVSIIPRFFERDDVDSLYLYATLQKYKLPEHADNEEEYCPLAFDLDCADINKAYEETKALVNYFVSNHGVNIAPDAMMVYYSGNRGFHVTLNAELFGAEPMVDMIKVWRLVVEDIVTMLKLTTVDRSVYTRRRQWRVPNTKHVKTGLYKRALLYDQLMSGIDDIRELAQEPADWIDIEEVI